MADVSSVVFSLDNVRRMSDADMKRLNKNQLMNVLKEAIQQIKKPAVQSLDVQVVKAAVAEAIAEIKIELLSESKKLIDKVEEKFEDRFASLEESITNTRCDIIDEIMLRESKKNNVIVFGLPETDQSYSDRDRSQTTLKNAVDELVSEVGMEDEVKIKRVFRLGTVRPNSTRPRPVKIVLESEHQKSSLVRASYQLRKLPPDHRYRNVYVNNDLTPEQQNAERFLRFQLKQRRDQGDDVFVRRGKIVSRTR